MYPVGYKTAFQKALLAGTDDLFDVVPHLREKWTKEAAEFAAPDLSVLGGRLLNTFCVGSDPEFCFASGKRKTNATEFGLRPALAFGSDQNSRLAELRPAPSRSVVAHVASLLSTMRWMVRRHPGTLQCSWRAGAFYDEDGMGGHVHFGRKRPTREQEIEGLDGLARAFRAVHFFPNDEWDRRVGGDARHQIYGQYGDFRPQAHGYEYRTLPSWLNSPLLAFVVITASKLIVLDPSVSRNWTDTSAPQSIRNLRMLAKLYAGRDDDARILYHILMTRAEELVWTTQDFKISWGLDVPLTSNPVDGTYEVAGLPYRKWGYTPSMIWPQEAEIVEMREYLVQAKPLGFPPYEENFVTQLPKGYLWLYDSTGNVNRPGVGDFFHNLVVREKVQFTLQVGEYTSLSQDMFNNKELRALLSGQIGRLTLNRDFGPGLVIGREFIRANPAGARAVKRFLVNGPFPVWTVEGILPDSYEKCGWTPPVPVKKIMKKKPLLVGREL